LLRAQAAFDGSVDGTLCSAPGGSAAAISNRFDSTFDFSAIEGALQYHRSARCFFVGVNAFQRPAPVSATKPKIA